VGTVGGRRDEKRDGGMQSRDASFAMRRTERRDGEEMSERRAHIEGIVPESRRPSRAGKLLWKCGSTLVVAIGGSQRRSMKRRCGSAASRSNKSALTRRSQEKCSRLVRFRMAG
jgi:hypothetical protein